MITETILGGLTGFLGNAVTSIANYKMQKLTNAHKKEMAEIDLLKMEKEKEFMLAEAEANMRITEVQTEAQMDMTDSQSFAESIRQAEKPAISDSVIESMLSKGRGGRIIAMIVIFLMGMVDFFKRLIRPSLTVYLVGLTTWITFAAWQVLQEKQSDFTATQAEKIFSDVSTIVIYLTVTCVTWWFGDRRMAKFLTRLQDGNIKNQASITGALNTQRQKGED